MNLVIGMFMSLCGTAEVLNVIRIIKIFIKNIYYVLLTRGIKGAYFA